MNSYFSKWTIQRVLQLVVGLYFSWNYVEDGQLLSLLFGGMMTFQALTNVGCFSTKGCAVPNSDSDADYSENDEIDFEEIK